MSDQAQFQQYRRIERRHMIAVKNAFAAGLAAPGDDASASADFLGRCVDYLEFIIGRFVQQAQRNLAGLRRRVPREAEADWRIIRDIERTMADTADRIDALAVAVRRYQAGSSKGREDFQREAETFVRFYDGVLAGRKDPAQEIIRRHFTDEEYWQLSNDVTAQSVDRERELFQQVMATAPPGVASQLSD